MNPKLKPPGAKRLKLNCDVLLSTSAFKFNLRRYIMGAAAVLFVLALEHRLPNVKTIVGRGLHSSTFQLNLSRSGHTSPYPPV